jgi:hypothetical protein
MNHPIDFFDAAISLRDERTGATLRPMPVQIEAVSRAYRALLEAYADRKFTPATTEAVRSLHGLNSRAMVEAALDGCSQITGQADGNKCDENGDPIRVTVTLRERTLKQQAANDLSVERAFDALRTAVGRFDRAHPQLASNRRQVFLADDRAAYVELLRLAVTPASRHAAAGMLGALGRTERQSRSRAAALALAKTA